MLVGVVATPRDYASHGCHEMKRDRWARVQCDLFQSVPVFPYFGSKVRSARNDTTLKGESVVIAAGFADVVDS